MDLPRYRTSLEVSHVTVEGRAKVELCDPVTENEVRLGEMEYRVATLFDGSRTAEDISAVLRDEDGVSCPPEKVTRLAERLVAYGVLEVPGRPQRPARLSPLTGLQTGGKLDAILVVRLLEIRGDDWLVALLGRAPWLARRAFASACAAVIVAALLLVALRRDAFARDVAALELDTVRFWLLALVLGGAANVVHEVAHAVACRAQGVRVLGMGWVLHHFLLAAWVRPGKSWRQLDRRGRLACILAGPFASLVVSGVALLVWALVAQAAVAEVGLILALSSAMGAAITLVPVHSGDGYVLLTDLLEIPDLRQQTVAYVRNRLRGRPVGAPRRRQWLLALFAVGMVVWRLAVIAALLYVVWITFR